MSFYCTSCGKVFDEPYEYEECVGEFWGAPAHQRFSECPYCGGGYEEAESCGWCYGSFNPDELLYFPCTGYDRICRECLSELEEKYKSAFFKREVPEEEPGFTYQDYFDWYKTSKYGSDDFFQFLCDEEPANEAFFLFVKEMHVREAAERGKASNVKINYSEVKR